MNPQPLRPRVSGALSASFAPLVLCAALTAWTPAHAQLPSGAEDPQDLRDSRALLQSGELGASARRLTLDENRLYWDRSPDGLVWARGNGFKASFGPDGAAITPFLGSDAPRNYPVTFALQSATVGGVEIAVEHGVAARHEGANVRFERGAIVEAYDLDARSIEQSFDLHAPVGTGDLALRIAYASELEARQVADGIEFRNERGGLDYTHAVAIDARGEVIEMPALLVDGAIEIVVPAEFLELATYPVRVDPTVTTGGVDVSTQTDRNPDVAYTFGSQNSLVAFQRVFSTTDGDIAVAVVSPAGVVVAGEYVDFTDDSWSAPSLASVRSSNRFLVAGANIVFGESEPSAWARVIEVTAVPVAAAFRISTTPAAVSDVQVGGTDVVDPNGKYLVTWTRQVSATDSRIVRRVLTASGGFVTAPIEHSSIVSDSRARVSHTAENGEWTVVWERTVSATNHDIGLGRVQSDGTMTSSMLVNSPADETKPDVSTRNAGNGFVVVTYETHSEATARDIQALVLDGMTTVSSFSPSALDGSAAEDTYDASVATDGHHFVVTYTRDSGLQPRVSEYYVLDAIPVQAGFVEGQDLGGFVYGRTSVASRDAAGTTSRRQAVVWSRNFDIWLARVDGRVGGPYEPVCFGDGTGSQCPCGNNGGAGRGCANSANASGAQLSGSGNALIGGDTLLLSGSGMPPNSSCLYLQGTFLSLNPAVFGDGLRCATGTIVRLASKSNGPSGASSYPGPGDQPVSVRGGLPTGGGTRTYQLWYRNAANFCTSSSFNLSNGLRVTFTL